MIALLLLAVTALGDERLIVPPAAVVSRGMARSADRIVVAEATLAGVRAVIADFDGGNAAVVSLSPEPSHTAAAASDGHDALVTWIAGGALHGALLRGDIAEPLSLGDTADDDSPLVQTAQIGGGQWYLRNAALTRGYAVWVRRAGRTIERLEGSPLGADLAPLAAETLSAESFSTSTDIRSAHVVPLGSEFLVVWQSGTCGCPYDGVWAAEVNSGGAIRSRVLLRRDGLAPAAVELPGDRAAIVYTTSEGVMLRIVAPTAGRRRSVTR